MKESNWNDCIESNSAIKITPDISKSKSLYETAKARIKFIENNEISKSNANFIFEIYYNSLIEILHSIIIKKGYNINNHICLGFYIKDILKKEKLFREFDDCRYKRNSLIYYGKQMYFEIAKESIEKIKKIIIELENEE